MNTQIEQAAKENPFLLGEMNYQPQIVDRLLVGNTAEENSALKRIASRLIAQQQAADPAQQGIDVNLPTRGQVVVFKRSVQVDGDDALSLSLKVVPKGSVTWWGFMVSLISIASLVALSLRTREREVL